MLTGLRDNSVVDVMLRRLVSDVDILYFRIARCLYYVYGTFQGAFKSSAAVARGRVYRL